MNNPLSTNKKFAHRACIAAVCMVLIAGFAHGSSAVTQPKPWTTAKGPLGQSLTVARSSGLIDKQDVMVSGKNFNTKIGIYVAYCVIPPKGAKPDPCYGGINLDQSSNGSMWVSSNPPWYGYLIATRYGPQGTFRFPIQVSKTIDDIDCTKVKCGIISRADHTRGNYRKADVFIPVTFK